MPNNKFVLYAKRIAIATAIIVVVLHQFCPRNTLALLRIEHDEIARIEVTMIPDDSVDIVSFFVEKPEMINQLLDYISKLKLRPHMLLERPQSINRNISLNLYDSENKCIASVVLDRPEVVYVSSKGKAYIVYNSNALSDLTIYIHGLIK
ncbi:MAG: hypothetical protein IJE43_11980 [Alphaproteobacteria bacterium]|nr:hypothetical protein [Alphaproteobacteria bacterium]